MSALKCTFDDTEKDITAALQLLALTSEGIQRCLAAAHELVCNVVYKDCENPGQLPTREHCLEVKDGLCKDYWDVADDLLQRNTEIGHCLALPDCEKAFPPQDDENRGIDAWHHPSSG